MTPGAIVCVAIGLPPGDPGIVVVDPEDAVLFRFRSAAQAVLELGALDVHGHPPGEVLQAAGVVVVQVADGHGVHVVQADPGVRERLVERLAGTGQDRLDDSPW